MTDEQLIESLRRTLRTEAAAVTSPSDAWEDFQQRRWGKEPASVLTSRKWWLALPVAAVAAAAAVVLFTVLRSSPRTSKLSTTTPAVTLQPASGPSAVPPATAGTGTVPTSPATNPPARPGPPGGPVPKGFSPTSVTFVSLNDGWVLGSAPCGKPPCTSLLRTSDGGKSWVGIPAPPVTLSLGGPPGVHEVRFADLENGWVFGPDLWVTHDGGAHWSRPALRGLSANAEVTDLEAASGLVHAAVIDSPGVVIETSPVGHDSWQGSPTVVPVGAGPVPTAQIVLHGQAGWLIEVDRTVVGGARLVRGGWVPWQPPCATTGGPAMLTASSATDLTAVCDEGIWTGPAVSVQAWLSADGGITFHQAAAPVPVNSAGAVAGPVPQTAVVSGSATDGTPMLAATFDGGANWRILYRGQPNGSSWDLGFTSRTRGVAVVGDVLVMTVDGGHVWTPVAFQQAHS